METKKQIEGILHAVFRSYLMVMCKSEIYQLSKTSIYEEVTGKARGEK